MLQPGDRRVLLEALRPPQGYVVDRAIATTYSLDLVALLVAPLSFSLFDRLARDPASSESDDVGATALLHAVRSHAERLTVFCQAGAIARPGRYRQLLVYLEGSVVEVCSPSESGVFHPKVWVQRLTCANGPVRYRLLVNSRNLTFDRSWDTMLVLDGELKDRTNGFSVNRPLADFLATLPQLATKPTSPRVATDVTLIADEIRRVAFEIPDGFDDDGLRFWPLGYDGKARWPFDTRIDRMLVVSPFITGQLLGRVTETGAGHVLVSRPEELSRIPAKRLQAFADIFTLNESAEPETEDQDGTPRDTNPKGAEAATGLHAKLYVADSGSSAHVWTGSANATEAAFWHNVEFVVQLTGKKSKVGVDAILGEAEGTAACLRALLVPFTPLDEPIVADAVQEALEQRVRSIQDAISRRLWKARVDKLAEAEDAQERYLIRLHAAGEPIQLGAEIRCWPISLPPDYASSLEVSSAGLAARFPRCSFQALTSFFAFEVKLSEGDHKACAVFVINAVMEGAPQNRQTRLLQAMLDDPAKVLRFLRMLLAIDPVEGLEEFLDAVIQPEGAKGTWGKFPEVTPLLEALLEALDRDPTRLEEFDRTLGELRATPEGAALLPGDLDSIWNPVREAWKSLPRRRGGRA